MVKRKMRKNDWCRSSVKLCCKVLAAITVLNGGAVLSYNVLSDRDSSNAVFETMFNNITPMTEASAEQGTVITVKVSTDKLGNIFVGKQMRFNVSLTNSQSAAVGGSLTYTVYDENGAAATEKTIPVTANGGETIQTVTESLEKYGVYTIDFTFTDSQGKNNATAKSEFSLLPKAEKNRNLGFSQHVVGRGRGTKEDAVYLFDLLGMGIVRDDFASNFVIKHDGSSTYPDSDPSSVRLFGFAEKMRENDVDTLAILGAGDNIWPKNNPEGDNIVWPISVETATTTKALKYWGDYCYRLAYKMRGKCDTFEVFNEWLVHQYSKPDATEEAYAMVLKTSAEAIRRAQPNAKIVAMCAQDDDWVENVLKALGDNPGQYFDVISIHPYNYWLMSYPEQKIIESEEVKVDHTNRTDLKNFKKLLAEYGVVDKPIYATEYGYTLYPSNWKYITEHMLAAYTIRSTVINGEFAEKQYIYTMYQKSWRPYLKGEYYEGDRDEWTKERRDEWISGRAESAYGVMRYCEANPKLPSGYDPNKYEVKVLEDWQEPSAALPGAVAITAYNSVMSNATYKSDSILRKDSPDTVYDYQYTTKDGEVTVIWDTEWDQEFVDKRGSFEDMSDIPDKTINIHIDEREITVYDMYGNGQTMKSNKGNYTITINQDPIYIKAKSMDGLRRIADGDLPTDNGYTMPYSNSEWNMIFNSHQKQIGTRYKEGDGFGKETNAGKSVVFEMWY